MCVCPCKQTEISAMQCSSSTLSFVFWHRGRSSGGGRGLVRAHPAVHFHSLLRLVDVL